ncbi:MAG: hypothetical protein ACAI35_02180 [Candidatus Methylacidiphilales bacterium]|nr:hypothetical protein [Candidatus Methylacidiphilales bacterium]
MASAPPSPFNFEAACSAMEARLAAWDAWQREAETTLQAQTDAGKAPCSTCPPSIDLAESPAPKSMAPAASSSSSQSACPAFEFPGGVPPRVAVLVAPWLQTGVPFLSLEVALRLRHLGCHVTLLLDAADLTFNRYSGFGDECALLEHLIGSFSAHFPVIRVDAIPVTPQTPAAVGDDTFWSRLLFENAVLTLRGEQAGRNYMAKHAGLMQEWKNHSRLVRSVFTPTPVSQPPMEADTAPGIAGGSATEDQFHWVFLPEGALGLTGIYIRVLRELGLRFVTSDYGMGELAVCMDGVANFFDDLPSVLRDAEPRLTTEDWATIQRCTDEELDNARHGRDGHDVEALQRSSPEGASLDEELESDVLLCLSYRPDTALVLRQSAFASVEAWIRAVIAWAKSTRRRVIVRQHPCERLPEYLGTDDYAALIEDADPSGNVARFVAADEMINTYALVERTSVVLPCVSRIGVEAGIMGKPVLLGIKCFYSGLGFTEAATTPQNYFSDLERILKRGPSATIAPEDARKARLLYFLLGTCVYLPTTFTPTPEDCVVWMARPPRELWETSELIDLTKALIAHQPLAEVRSRRTLLEEVTFRASFKTAPR